MTKQTTLVAQIENRITHFEAEIAALVDRVARHGALIEIASGIADGRIACADPELAAAAVELTDYLNSPEKWPELVTVTV